MIDLEDATDDEIASGMSTPLLSVFPVSTPLMLPSTFSVPMASAPAVAAVTPAAATTHFFVTAVRIPIRKQSHRKRGKEEEKGCIFNTLCYSFVYMACRQLFTIMSDSRDEP